MFKTTMNKGFHMTFDNGITISVQWGLGNYCESGRLGGLWGDESKQQVWSSADAEIAIWDEHNDWITADVAEMVGMRRPNDEVIGHLQPHQVLMFMNAASKL